MCFYLYPQVISNGIKLKGRLIHDQDGKTSVMQYGTKEQDVSDRVKWFSRPMVHVWEMHMEC